MLILDTQGKPAVVTIVGPDSKAHRDATRKIQNRRLEAANKGRGRVKVTAEELEASGIEVLVAVTRGWHLVAFDGTVLPVPFSAEVARKVNGDPRFAWIKEQVDAALGSREGLTQSSATN